MDGNVNEMSRYLSEASKYNLSNSDSKLEKNTSSYLRKHDVWHVTLSAKNIPWLSKQL